MTHHFIRIEGTRIIVDEAAEPPRELRPGRGERVVHQKRRVSHLEVLVKHAVRAQEDGAIVQRAMIPVLLPRLYLVLRERILHHDRLDASIGEQSAGLLQFFLPVTDHHAFVVVILLVGEDVDQGALFQLRFDEVDLDVHAPVNRSFQVLPDTNQRGRNQLLDQFLQVIRPPCR